MESTRVYFLILLSLAKIFLVEAAKIDIGVNYGLKGNNLPSHAEAINLYKKYNIGKIRLVDPVPEVLEALRGSGINAILGVRNRDLPKLAASYDATKTWFDTYVQPYVGDVYVPYIAVGNEVVPGEFGQYVLPVMKHLHDVLMGYYHYPGIRATTVILTSTLGTSNPPSAGAFSEATASMMSGILKFMSDLSWPLMVNVYPYHAYAADPVKVSLDYALLNATEPVVRDGNLNYTNMMDAFLDAFYSAMEKLGVANVDLVVSESGWPSAGNGNFTTPELAATYNRNFVKKFSAKAVTPKRPDRYIEGFIYAMFNENLKPAGVEQNFGLFYPDGKPVYPVFT